MESYIVRIYRRDSKAPRKVAGTVECVGGEGEKQGFDDMEDLVSILGGEKRGILKSGFSEK